MSKREPSRAPSTRNMYTNGNFDIFRGFFFSFFVGRCILGLPPRRQRTGRGDRYRLKSRRRSSPPAATSTASAPRLRETASRSPPSRAGRRRRAETPASRRGRCWPRSRGAGRRCRCTVEACGSGSRVCRPERGLFVRRSRESSPLGSLVDCSRSANGNSFFCGRATRLP